MSVHQPDPACWQEQRPTEGRATSPTGFYARYGKRILDVIFSTAVLIVAFPFLLLIALAVKFSSRGPIFFRQERVGRDGVGFRIVKFRSMRENAESLGPLVTALGDKRITVLGAFLRSTKLDEFPQFWNVLLGNMSLVGPRPEVPKYVALYAPEQRAVLSIRPGITDPASLEYRHEEEIIGHQVDPEEFYAKSLMPRKLALNLEYVSSFTFLGDLHLIWATARATLRTKPR